MKTRSTPPETTPDDELPVDFQEMFSLLMGKDMEARRAFREGVIRRAEKIRRNRRIAPEVSAELIDFSTGLRYSA